jgi:hypothetical protein
MTRNDCYTAGRRINPLGIMVHSTATPGVMKERWFELWNKSYKAGEIDRQVCVHAFVDDTGGLQCLPWDHRGWHAGGSANDSHIGFELCEPPGFKYINNVMIGYDAKVQETYFRKVWNNAIELCVYLCRLYGLTERDIICHSEGYKLGVASNHADVMHWWPRHGKSMDTFRAAVKATLIEQEDEQMTQEKFNRLMDAWLEHNDPLYRTLDDVPAYWKDDAAALVRAGAIRGDGVNNLGVRASALKAAIIAKRYSDSVR